MSAARFLRLDRSSLAVLAVAGLAGISAIVACTATSDPRAGQPGTSSSGGTSGASGNASSSSSGGIDAAIPDAPIECGAMPGVAASFTKQALLGAAAECAAWHACTFQNAATGLRSAFRAYADAPDDAKKAAAASAWKTAMNEQSKMEIFQFGPVGSSTIDRYHGRGLRNFVHPWPDLNRCQVETQVVLQGYKAGWDQVFPSSRGLFAVEYALFYPGVDTACLSNSTAAQTWAGKQPAELATLKNEYAGAVADNVVALALEIRNVWAPEGENFAPKLLAFDKYGSEQETLNVVAWSLFYPEDEIKDRKIGVLAGIQPPPYNSEAPFARVDIENIRTNLQAWRHLFQGCSADFTGVGFDDWLVAAGQPQLATDMLAALARAQTAADAFPAYTAATPEQFAAFYAEIKPLSDLLKTSFFGSASPLNLKLPASAASDTD